MNRIKAALQVLAKGAPDNVDAWTWDGTMLDAVAHTTGRRVLDNSLQFMADLEG